MPNYLVAIFLIASIMVEPSLAIPFAPPMITAQTAVYGAEALSARLSSETRSYPESAHQTFCQRAAAVRRAFTPPDKDNPKKSKGLTRRDFIEWLAGAAVAAGGLTRSG